MTGNGYALTTTATKPVMVYVASDSTGCDQTDTDYAGWGQMLPQYFAPPVDVANYADSGESSASFLGSGAEWGAVKAAMVQIAGRRSPMAMAKSHQIKRFPPRHRSPAHPA